MNLLKEFVSPTIACTVLIEDEPEDDFGPSGREGQDGRPAIIKQLNEEEKEE